MRPSHQPAHPPELRPAQPTSRRRRGLLTIAAAVLGASTVIVAITANAAVPPTPGGWTLTFSDDFTGPSGSSPSGANWIMRTGHQYQNPPGPPFWGTGEIAAHTTDPRNVSTDGQGNLRITPLRDGGGNWTSARIETQRTNFRPGPNGVVRVEARIQMPNVTGEAAKGYWPAFWMLGSPYRGNHHNWPGIGEFDIMENVNGINNVWGVLHCDVNPGGACNETSGRAGSRPCPGASCQSAFHTYRFEWDASVNPNQLRWYVDGQQFHSVSQADLPGHVWAQMTNHAGYFIILNVAIGGAFPNAVPGGPTPVPGTRPGVPMLVDYVAVWNRGPGGPSDPPPSSQPPGPQPCGPPISQGRPVTASSIESPNQAAAFAVDGNLGTRWSSAHSDNHWLRVDLGSSRPISSVRLNWEAAYSTAYEIQTSTDGSSWTTRHSTFSGDGGVDDVAVNATARYVRMFGSSRATPYGHSLWEFQVFGTCPSSGPAPSSPRPSSPGPTSPGPTSPGGTWAPGVHYTVGAQVTYGDVSYRCLQAHTSQVTWEPPYAASLWQRL